MFGILSQLLSKKQKKVPNSYRPRIEQLEDRWCPAISFNATVLAGHSVQFSGTVSGEYYSGVHVWITGAATASTTTDSNGNYSLTTSNASLGAVYALSSDDLAHALGWAETTIAVTAPSVSLSLAYGTRNNVTVSGTVTGLDVASRNVTIAGVSSGTAVTDDSGNFSLTTTASAVGNITATTVDPWWQSSNTATVTVSSNAPVIEDFGAIHGFGNIWIFRGRVVDESPAGLTIRFGGLSSLSGRTVTVDDDGTFSFARTLDPMMDGRTASAIVTDWFGIQSELVLCDVS